MTVQIPSLPASVDQKVRRALRILTDAINNVNSDGGLTRADVERIVADLDLGTGGEGPGYPIPDPPTGLVVTGAFNSIILTWDQFPQVGFSYMEVWRCEEDNLSTAVMVGTTQAFIYSDIPPDSSLAKVYYYWIRAVNRNDPPDYGPFNSENGTPGSTADDHAHLLELLFQRLGYEQFDSASGIFPVRTAAELPVLPDPSWPAGSVAYLLSDGKLYRTDGATWTKNIATGDLDGDLNFTQFASGIEPVGIVDTLPAVDGYDGPLVVFLTTDGKLYRFTGGAWSATVLSSDLAGQIGSSQIAPDAIGLTHFASGIVPVEILSSLPTSGNYVGRIVFKTTDGKLYRYTSSGWSAAVAATDLVGTVVADAVADGAITTASFAAGIAPVEIVSALPTVGNFVGRQALLTSDSKLYRFTLSGWTAAVSTSDLSGQISAGQIAANAVTAGVIAAGAVSAGQIATGAVLAEKIAAGAITAEKVSANAIETAAIAADAVTTAKIAAGAITATEIAADAVIAGKIAAGAVSATEIATGAITADKIAAGAVTATKLAAYSVVAGKIAAGAVTATKLAAYSVVAGKIAAGAIRTTELAADAVTTDKIAAGAVTATEIAASAITAGKIAAGAVLAASIGSNEVIANTANIKDGTITNAKIASLAADKIYASRGTIAAALIGTGHISNAMIANAAINYAKIADAAITNAKIGTAAVDTLKIAGNSVTVPAVGESTTTSVTVTIGNFTNQPIVAMGRVKTTLVGDFKAGAAATVTVYADVLVEGGSWVNNAWSDTFSLFSQSSWPESFVHPVMGIVYPASYGTLSDTNLKDVSVRLRVVESGNISGRLLTLILVGAKR